MPKTVATALLLCPLTAIVFAVLLVQAAVTFFATNTRRFSAQAYVINCAIITAVYLAIQLRCLWYLLIPVGLKAVFVLLYNLHGNVQPYITTEYLYSDFFENVTRDDKCSTFYTEGDYYGLVPVNTNDHSPANERVVLRWGLRQHARAAAGRPVLLDSGTMRRSQRKKYAWIVRTLGITASSRVLELGFGKIDLMRYMRDTVGATVEGTNLSDEQIGEARALGFRCYRISHTDLGLHVGRLGQYDAVITNGTLEYMVAAGQADAPVYDRFVRAVQALLRPGGKWYTTTIHLNRPSAAANRSLFVDYMTAGRSAKDLYNLYMLAVGNEGSYPPNPDGITKHAERHGMRTLVQQDRTLDYFCYSVNWMACQLHAKRARSATERARTALRHLACWVAAPNYMESYACYTPVEDPTMLPWLWQFVRQPNGFRPVTHQWLVFGRS
jgi:cyclopropane fatty-acyl-phospholipid synthase-like methyltransferase